MNGKIRMLKAMGEGLSSGFPVVACYLGILVRDHWEEVTTRPWWAAFDPRIGRAIEVQEDLVRTLDLDWLSVGLAPTREWRDSRSLLVIGDRAFIIDHSTGERIQLHRPPVGGVHIRMAKHVVIRTARDLEIEVPRVDAVDLESSGRLDRVKAMVARFGSERFLFAQVGSPYWTALVSLFGLKGMMLSMFRNGPLVTRALDRLLENAIQKVRAYARAGVDGVWLEECLASSTEVTPAQFDRFILPYNRVLLSEIRRLGMKSIYYPCGDVMDRLEAIVEAGPDCVSLEESKKNFRLDLSEIDRVVDGRACIFGNLDAIGMLERGPKRELEAEIARQVCIGRRTGRFVMSLGSPVTPGTPISRVREYVQLTRLAARGPDATG